MDEGQHITHEVQSDNLPGEEQGIVVCPNCGMEGPRGIYCNNCGYPLFINNGESKPVESEDEYMYTGPELVEAEVPSEAVMEPDFPLAEEDVGLNTEMPSNEIEADVEDKRDEGLTLLGAVRARARNLVRRYRGQLKEDAQQDEEEELFEHASEDSYLELKREFEGDMGEEDIYDTDTETPDFVEDYEKIETQSFAPDIKKTHDEDPILKDVMESLVKSISMELWLLERLVDEKIDENAFNELFDSYSSRTMTFINSRKELLEGARDTSSMEKALTQARLKLEELEMRRDIGYISEAEYSVKAPGFEWDVNKYGGEISRRRAEETFLENLANIMSAEEVNRIRVRAENLLDGLNDLEASSRISPETSKTAKESLNSILDCINLSGDQENYI